MRFNKDFIAEMLAAYSQSTTGDAQRRVDNSSADARSALEPAPARNTRETPRGPAAAPPLRDQQPVTRFIVGFTLAWLILLLINPKTTLAQPSLQTAESRARSDAHSFLPKAAALRPASARVAAVEAVALTVADGDTEAIFLANVMFAL